ncbi:MAG: hypothetical protein P4M08_05370 [Oligoflexia bacterium]|nr:hypothetical protein [Oligoflexia bacterium]
MKSITSISSLAILTLLSSPALAGEGLFSRVYTTETVPQGHFELEQTVRNRSGRAFGTFNATDLKSEFEYGITDNFQAAFYVNYGYIHASNAPDDNNPTGGDGPGLYDGFSRNGFALDSVSAEFIYRVLSPISDPIGLAFYIEPEWDFHDIHNGARTFDSTEMEYRILLQKNFLDDQLILAYNLVAEWEYFRYAPGDEQFLGEFDWNNELGATYRVAPNWYAGWEIRNHNEVGNFYSHDHSVFWTGPAIHYGGPKYWATLGVLRQFYGDPTGVDSSGSYIGENLYLHSHERWEITAKMGIPF